MLAESMLLFVMTVSPVAADPAGAAVQTDEKAITIQPVEVFSPARTVEIKNPKYPQNALNKGLEGWVVLGYMVDVEGHAQAPIVIDSSDPVFEQAAIKSVMAAKYQPAMQNGEPVESCTHRRRFTFALGDWAGRQTVSKRFARLARHFRNAATDNEQETMAELYEKLNSLEMNSAYEQGYFQLVSGQYFEAIGELERATNHYQRAVSWSSASLKQQNIIFAAQKTTNLLLQQEKYLEVMDFVNGLDDELRDVKEMQSVNRVAQKIEQHFAEVEVLKNTQATNDDGKSFVLLRRPVFELDAAEGAIDTFTLRCRSKYITYSYAGAKTIHIPKEWGECGLSLTGQPNTSFSVYQYKE